MLSDCDFGRRTTAATSPPVYHYNFLAFWCDYIMFNFNGDGVLEGHPE